MRYFLLALLLVSFHVTAADCPPLLDSALPTLTDDKPASLCQYRGKVLLVVNTASQCGYTPQYDGLEKLYKRYKDKGLVVLGFPSNDFGAQEPGSNKEIAKFCEANYGVTSRCSTRPASPRARSTRSTPSSPRRPAPRRAGISTSTSSTAAARRRSPSHTKVAPSDQKLVSEIERCWRKKEKNK